MSFELMGAQLVGFGTGIPSLGRRNARVRGLPAQAAACRRRDVDIDQGVMDAIVSSTET